MNDTLVAANEELTRAGSARRLCGLFFYLLKLGSFGFGGPIALCGYLHRELVEERRWYTDALALVLQERESSGARPRRRSGVDRDPRPRQLKRRQRRCNR